MNTKEQIEEIQDWDYEGVNWHGLPHEQVDQKIEILADKINEIISYINKNENK